MFAHVPPGSHCRRIFPPSRGEEFPRGNATVHGQRVGDSRGSEHRLEETAEKQIDCLRERSFIALPPIRRLQQRLRKSREIPALLDIVFLTSLPAGVKDLEGIVTAGFDDLLLPIPVGICGKCNAQEDCVDNADWSISREFLPPESQLAKLKQAGAIPAVTACRHAVARFFFLAAKNEWKIDTLPREEFDAAIAAIDAFCGKEGIPAVLRDSFIVFASCLRVLVAEETAIPAIGETGKHAVEAIHGEVTIVADCGDGAMLSQLSQLVNQTMVWLFLLLPKNKKCKKPSVPKNPVFLEGE